MSWEINVWHEELDDRTRLCVEASPQVPDEVIASVAGAYWFEEVQFGGADWDEEEELEEGPEGPSGHLHG